MRSHGVTNYPDPAIGPNGDLTQNLGSGVDPGSPTFKTAAQACQQYGPQGGGDGQGQGAPDLAAGLKYSQCMRSHGVSNYPDPNATSNGVGGLPEISRTSGIDVNSPTFQAAQNACRSLLPVAGGG